MSRRRRCAQEKSVRSRIARAKVLRRRARGARPKRAATAAIAAAFALAGVGASTAVATTNAVRAVTLTNAARSAVAPLAGCPDPQTLPSDPGSVTDAMGTVFFTADDGRHGRELWKSDRTKADTVLVKNIMPGDNSSDPESLTGVGTSLLITRDCKHQ